MSRKFFKTTFVIEVLSEDSDVSHMSLYQLSLAITEGDYSGEIKSTEVVELNKTQVETALIEQGNSPDFFNLLKEDDDE